MKFGFRIVIHKDVSSELMEEARKQCDSFLKFASVREQRKTEGYGGIISYRPASYASGYAPSVYRRGMIGHVFADNKLTFRRLSRNRRIFGVVPISMIQNKDGSELHFRGSWCACCVNDGKKVTMKPYDESDYRTFIEVGEIKG